MNHDISMYILFLLIQSVVSCGLLGVVNNCGFCRIQARISGVINLSSEIGSLGNGEARKGLGSSSRRRMSIRTEEHPVPVRALVAHGRVSGIEGGESPPPTSVLATGPPSSPLRPGDAMAGTQGLPANPSPHI